MVTYWLLKWPKMNAKNILISQNNMLLFYCSLKKVKKNKYINKFSFLCVSYLTAAVIIRFNNSKIHGCYMDSVFSSTCALFGYM